MTGSGSIGLWAMVLACIAATYVWRGLGATLAMRIDPGGAVFHWIRCVSYALLAALICRMTVLPIGGLAETPLTDRLAGMAVAFLVYFAARRNVLAGMIAGIAAFMVISAVRGAGMPGG